MGLPVLIYGKSGSGKSRSLKFFDEDEIVLLNTERKELPFKKRFKNPKFWTRTTERVKATYWTS